MRSERYREPLETAMNLKPRSKAYREERIGALLRPWPDLKDKDVRFATFVSIPPARPLQCLPSCLTNGVES
jgi:hypothetical protein